MRLAFVTACMWALFLLPAPVYPETCGPLIISAGAEDWHPVAYRDKDSGQIKGIAFDMVAKVAEKLNVRLTVKQMPWKRMLELLKDGRLDMAIAIYWNAERDQYLSYSVPYLDNAATIFVRKNNVFSFTKFEDLLPYHGLKPAGGSFGEAFDKFARQHNLSLREIHGASQVKEKMVTLVLRERYDYFIADYLDGMMFLKQTNRDTLITPLEKTLNMTQVHFAISRKSDCLVLLPEINAALRQLKNDGTVDRIIHTCID